MSLKKDGVYRMESHGSQNNPWSADDIEEFMAVMSGDAWIICTR